MQRSALEKPIANLSNEPAAEYSTNANQEALTNRAVGIRATLSNSSVQKAAIDRFSFLVADQGEGLHGCPGKGLNWVGAGPLCGLNRSPEVRAALSRCAT